jgi:hypothetical protein
MKRCAASSKDAPVRSSLFHLSAVSVRSRRISENLDGIKSRDRRFANIIHHFE